MLLSFSYIAFRVVYIQVTDEVFADYETKKYTINRFS
jgi:hypothetical protein